MRSGMPNPTLDVLSRKDPKRPCWVAVSSNNCTTQIGGCKYMATWWQQGMQPAQNVPMSHCTCVHILFVFLVVWVYARISLNKTICVAIYACISVCVYRQTDRQTASQTDSQTDRYSGEHLYGSVFYMSQTAVADRRFSSNIQCRVSREVSPRWWRAFGLI